jgi:hypothetical protein
MSYAFPKVKIITTEIDDRLNEKLYVVPGIGNFGGNSSSTAGNYRLSPVVDRYFGTD